MSSRTPTSSAVFEVVNDDAPTKLDRRWDHARALLAQGRHTAALLAEEIERLRGEFLKDKTANLRRGPISQVVKSEPGEGFVAQLREQLGLHPMQAKRLVENTARTHLLAQITDAEDGETIALPDEGGSLRVTADVRDAARAAFQDLTLGNVTAGRAWAGFRGALATKSTSASPKNRAPVDPAKQLVLAFRSLQKWAPLFESLPLEDQALVAAVARDAGIPDVLEPVIAAFSKLKPEGR